MMSKPKILVFIDWFIPGYKAGGPISSCHNMMNHLEDFDFYVVTSDKDYLEAKPYPNILYNQWNHTKDNINIRYLSSENQTKETYKQIINADDFSRIYINGIYSKTFSIYPLQVAKSFDIPIIIAARGMLKESAISVKKTKKKLFLLLSRWSGLHKNVIFHVTNNDEREDVLRRISKSAKIKIASNMPKKVDFTKNKIPQKLKGELKIISLARISPEKNLLYALQVLNQLDTNAKISFDIYGAKYDEDYWKQCHSEIKNLPNNISVNYKGVLHPESIEDTLFKYHLLFMPTRGENFGHVIFESISSGTPVLISDQTPWSNLDEHKVGFVRTLKLQHEFTSVLEDISSKGQQWMNDANSRCIDYAKSYICNNELLESNRNLFQ